MKIPKTPMSSTPSSPTSMRREHARRQMRSSAQRTFALIVKLTIGTLIILAVMIVLIYRQYEAIKVEQQIQDSMKLAQLCRSSVEAAARYGLPKELSSFSNNYDYWAADFDCGETSMTLRKFNPNMTSRLSTDGSGVIALEIFDLTDEGSVDEVVLIPFRDKDFQRRMQPEDFVQPHHKMIAVWKCGPVHYAGKDILMKYLPEDCREENIDQFRY